MRPQSHEEHIQHTFDSFCKKILKYKARDYYHKLKRRGEREVFFSELSEQDLAKLFVMDEYFKDAYSFSVQGYDVAISDEQLAEALNTIPADRRDIILLAYFLDMKDEEIAKRLNLVRRTVAYRRAKTLQELKKSWRETRMNKSKMQHPKTRLLPFPVIVAATNGDIGAINKVLKHYEGYIIALSTRRLYDEYGNAHLFLDDELRRTLETRLIAKILTFNAA